jgi:hypothetical protein
LVDIVGNADGIVVVIEVTLVEEVQKYRHDVSFSFYYSTASRRASDGHHSTW